MMIKHLIKNNYKIILAVVCGFFSWSYWYASSVLINNLKKDFGTGIAFGTTQTFSFVLGIIASILFFSWINKKMKGGQK